MANHYGKFTIPLQQVLEATPHVMAVMSVCAIIAAETDTDNGVVNYFAISQRFDDLAEGDEVPEYIWRVAHRPGEKAVASAVRAPTGPRVVHMPGFDPGLERLDG